MQTANQQQTVHFNVTRDETAKFAEVWRTKGGLVNTLDASAVAFATDWANVVIRNFMAMLAQMKQKADAQKAEEAKPKIIV